MQQTRVVLLASTLVLASACVTNVQHNVVAVPKQARIAVLRTNESGHVGATLPQSYIYNSLMQHGYWPVALNDADLSDLIPKMMKDVSIISAKDKQMLVADPAMLSAAQRMLLDKGVQYLLLVYSFASALDRDLQAMVVRVEDMTVASSRYYRKRVMLPMMVGFGVVPIGAIILPWFYLIDASDAQRVMIDEFIGTLGAPYSRLD